jgi:hypothetical protein
MKKNLLKRLSAMALTLVLALTGSTALAYSDKKLEAPKAKEVTIDGDLSEWDLTRSLRIAEQSQIIDQIEHWDGEEDCAMDVSMMWDEENVYFAVTIYDKDPFVYREGFPLDELDAIIFFLSTNPDADPDRTAYEATDWRIVTSVEDYYGDWFNFVDRDMIADPKGYETKGEYGDELVFEDGDYEAAFQKTATGATYEIKLPLHYLANDEIPQLTPAAGMTVGFDFSILDVDLPCPGIHSLRMQSSANLETTGDRKPAMYNVDENPSLWGTVTFVEE